MISKQILTLICAACILCGCAVNNTRVLHSTYIGKYRIDFMEHEYGLLQDNLHYGHWFALSKRNMFGKYREKDCTGQIDTSGGDTTRCRILFTTYNYRKDKRISLYTADTCKRTVEKVRIKP